MIQLCSELNTKIIYQHDLGCTPCSNFTCCSSNLVVPCFPVLGPVNWPSFTHYIQASHLCGLLWSIALLQPFSFYLFTDRSLHRERTPQLALYISQVAVFWQDHSFLTAHNCIFLSAAEQGVHGVGLSSGCSCLHHPWLTVPVCFSSLLAEQAIYEEMLLAPPHTSFWVSVYLQCTTAWKGGMPSFLHSDRTQRQF